MARFIPLIGSPRGRVGGVIVQRSRAGDVIRAYTAPTNPRTPAQSIARSILSQASRGWHNLTDAQKSEWDSWAATYYAPRDGREPGVMYTGQQAYTGQRASALHAIVAAAPIIQVVEPPGASIATTTQSVPTQAPSARHTFSWKVQGIDRPLELVSVAIQSMTQCIVSLGWAGGITAPLPPITSDSHSGEYTGIVIIASLSSQQVHGWQDQRRSRVIVACPPISGITGWTPSDHITLQLSIPQPIIQRLRLIPLTNLAVRLTVVGISSSTAQASIIGERTVIMAG